MLKDGAKLYIFMAIFLCPFQQLLELKIYFFVERIAEIMESPGEYKDKESSVVRVFTILNGGDNIINDIEKTL